MSPDLSLPSSPKAIRREDYAPPAYLIDTVDLHVSLNDEATTVRSRLAIRRNPERADGMLPLVLNGQELELVSVALNNHILDASAYNIEAETLTLPAVPDAFTLETVVRIRPQDNTALEGLYMSSGKYVTQCEAEGFRKITYFADRPDVMARYTTTIEADSARFPVLLSNGNLVASGKLDGGRHWAKWEDPFPKPCYLFALVAGNLALVQDSFTTVSGRKVDLRIYVEHGNEDKCAHAMQALKNSMAWDEQVYGLEYDLDIFMIVAVSDFNMGAMENKGLNIFNTKFVLARPDTATDIDYEGVEAVIAHEYFHNWTGNRITCRDWFQLTLKEGLTVFRDQEFSADMHSRAVKRIQDVRRLRSAQFAEDASPMAHPIRPDSYIEINNFYTTTVYEKGAEVIRMIHTLLGPEGFRKGTDLYFARHDGQAVTCDDFVAAMADANGANLTQFQRWYSQAGTPVIEAKGAYDAANQTYNLTLRQSCPPAPGQDSKQPFHIPVAVGLVGQDGKDQPLRLSGENAAKGTTRVLNLREAEQTFVFEDIPAPPQPSILRGFSAPVRLVMEQGDDELAFMAGHDSDAFNRWEAGQRLATRLLLKLVQDHKDGRSLSLPDMFVEAFRRTLNDRNLDMSFAALALALPSEGELGQQMDIIDVDGIHTARTFVRATLSRQLRDDLLARYQSLQAEETGGLDGHAMGRRALKNACLSYLMAAPDNSILAVAEKQFGISPTMTDTAAALSLLADHDTPARERALAEFYARWQGDPLVIDKWFSLQAMAQHPNTLDHVFALSQHPAFDLRNPNRVRSLVGSFAAGNPVHFHARNGKGYEFLANKVIKLDRLNPQIASRQCGAFARWRKYDAERQSLMRTQLERIAATPNLSRDVFEVVSKSLGQ